MSFSDQTIAAFRVSKREINIFKWDFIRVGENTVAMNSAAYLLVK